MRDHSTGTDAQQRLVARMQERIRQASQAQSTVLTTTDEMFTATGQLRHSIEAQAGDAAALAAEVEGGSDVEDRLAQRLLGYRQALAAALNEAAPAPHYQGITSGLEQRLEPDQIEEIMTSPVMQECADASLEAALYSGSDMLSGHPEPSRGGELFDRYLQAKHHWDTECSAFTTVDTQSGATQYIGYEPMAPVKQKIREVMTDQQLELHDQRRIDAAMCGHLPMAEQLHIDPLERHAEDYYAAPMILDTHATAGPSHDEAAYAATAINHRRPVTGPSLS